MSSLNDDLLALKLAILRDDSQRRSLAQSQTQTQTTPLRLNWQHLPPAETHHSIQLSSDSSSEAATALETRISTLLDRFEALTTRLQKRKPKVAPEPTVTESDMLRALAQQSAQLQGLFFAEILGDQVVPRPPRIHHEEPQIEPVKTIAEKPKPRKVEYHKKIVPAPSIPSIVPQQTRNVSVVIPRTPRTSVVSVRPASDRVPDNRKFRIIASSVLFTVVMLKKSLAFRQNPENIDSLLKSSQEEFISLIKIQRPLFHAINLLWTVTKKPMSLVYKSSFTNPHGNGRRAHRKIVQIIDYTISAIEKINLRLLIKSYKPTCKSLRTFDHLISTNISYPPSYIWKSESTHLSNPDTLPSTKTTFSTLRQKLSLQQGRPMILYFTLKAIIEIFVNPVSHYVVSKMHPRLEANLVAVLHFLFEAFRVACGDPVDKEKSEFGKLLPQGDYTSNWVSGRLKRAVPKWGKRLVNWGTKIYNEIEK